MVRFATVWKLSVITACSFMLPGMQGRLDNAELRILAAHNAERAKMGVASLRWDDQLAEGAQRWADHLSASGKFEHSPNRPGEPLEGENIWGGTPDSFTPESMVRLWIAEKRSYVAGVFPANSSTGRVEDVSHYTQLIWRRTEAVGCGLAHLGGEEILVCRYSQPGNVRGRIPI